jgi:hypothetical protein
LRALAGRAVLVPGDHLPGVVDERRAGARHLFVGRRVGQPPRGINLPVRAADRPPITQAQLACDLLVRHPLRQQPYHLALDWLQERQRIVFVPVAHLLHARGDLGVNKAAPGHCVFEERNDHRRQQIVALANVSIMCEDA